MSQKEENKVWIKIEPEDDTKVIKLTQSNQRKGKAKIKKEKSDEKLLFEGKIKEEEELDIEDEKEKDSVDIHGIKHEEELIIEDIQEESNEETQSSDPKDRFQCEICLKFFKFKSRLRLHTRTHFKRFECEKCNKTFLKFHFYKLHVCFSTCPECNLPMKSWQSLKTHLKRVHNKNIGKFECDYCGESFMTKGGTLVVHIKNCLRKKFIKFICDHCGKVFRNRHHFQDHVIRHAIHKIACKICQKMINMGGMRDHITKYHPKKIEKLECQECSKTFQCLKYLNAHLRNHGRKGKKEFQCQICKRKVCTKVALTKHLRTHDEKREKHLKCTECEFKTDRKDQLLGHLKTHDKQFECDVCHRRFAAHHRLKHHKVIHEDPEKLRCKVCQLQCSEAGSLRKHLKTHDKNREKKFKCNICGDGFYHSYNMKKHRERVHKVEIKNEEEIEIKKEKKEKKTVKVNNN